MMPWRFEGAKTCQSRTKEQKKPTTKILDRSADGSIIWPAGLLRARVNSCLLKRQQRRKERQTRQAKQRVRTVLRKLREC